MEALESAAFGERILNDNLPLRKGGTMTIRNSRFDAVSIKSTGSYVPAKILTNEEIVGDLPTSPEWIVQTLGIRQRCVADSEEFTSDLAARAGLSAIASAGLEPNEIDLIIVATSTPDRKVPSSACMAQSKMGIRNGCPAFDVAAVCSGFLYGITIAGQFIQNGVYDRALVRSEERRVGKECRSRWSPDQHTT